MKALFAGFLSVSLSGGIIIAVVIALRLILKKAPKALMCLLWAVVILRLLLPIQIESPFISLRPETPVFTNSDTQLFGEKDLFYEGELPSFIPVQYEQWTTNGHRFTVDYMMILSAVWGAVVLGMLIYTLLTYLKLKHRVREAIRTENNVYVCSDLDTAFLLGYIRPRVYLPAKMDDDGAKLVIDHERAHIRRGDNWFKLIAFLCLALHWFNPLVWVAYILICRDIEDACDEAVVRGLDEQGRRDYSSALLACGMRKRSLAGCPVAFGEISVRQRIMNVLRYRKPALWICIAAILLILLVLVFFITDPAGEAPPYYEELCASMGQPVEAVCKNLGISVDDLVSVDPTYNCAFTLPEPVEYKNGEFTLLLGFNITNGLLHSFEYTAQIQSDRGKAAEIALDVGKEMLDMLGQPTKESDGKERVALTEATKEKLVAIYENKRGEGAMTAFWDITDGAAPEVIDYLYEYRESDYWKEVFVGKKPVLIYPQFYLQLHTSRDSETDIIYIRLDYQVGLLESRYTPYKEQTWWDKAQNWLK